ncbi:heterokaryon incompatibility protein-domain-containing protein [Nemania serpens]|nr:heterokaryon incompatibility protein-domain-containing protein [Nemania serpens]
MSPPNSRQDDTGAKHFCSWCTAWRVNSGLDMIGYIEPNLQPIALESQPDEDWAQTPHHVIRREEPELIGKDDDLVKQQYTIEQARIEDDDELSYTESGNSDTDTEDLDDPDAKIRAKLGLPPPRRLPDLLFSSSTCFLCHKVWEAFNTWATEKYGLLRRLDVATSRVEMEGLWPKRLAEEGEQWDDYTGYGDDGVHGRLCFLQIQITVRDPENSGRWLGPYLRLQKSYEVAPSVADIFNSAGQSDECDVFAWPDNEPYVARKRPVVADMRLFQKWKGLCSAAHDGRCHPRRILFGGRQRLRAIRLIDVHTVSLVEIEDLESVSWVALSYVWGSTPFRTLTEETLAECEEAGALGASWVPDTIADAIQVTKGIGERYLWVDSLCIMQDSDADKAKFVPCMDIIYGCACVTIINTSGENALSGLPGVRPDTRFQAEEPFELDGTWVMQSHRKIGEANEIFGDSKWFTRGWTFQEAILSPRWLVFTPEQVYWECRQGTWREDACWELPRGREKNQTVIHDPAFDNGAFQDLWTLSSIQKVDKTYQSLVHSFVRREFTHESDVLEAFTGILRAITQISGIDFIWGLPRMFLGVALTWPCARDQLRRRTTVCRVEATDGDGTARSYFPSWSWVGWVGQVYFSEVFGHLDGEHAGLEFYHLDSVGTSKALTIRHIPQNENFRLYDNEYNEPFKGASPSWRGDTTAAIELSDVPEGLLGPDLRHTVLAFWTSCAELSLQYDEDTLVRDKWEKKPLSLWTDATTKLDITWDQYPSMVEQVGHDGNKRMWRNQVECIVAGRDSLERARERGQLRVLLVARHPSGGLSREGQVVIWEEDWNRMSNRRWEMVFLI